MTWKEMSEGFLSIRRQEAAAAEKHVKSEPGWANCVVDNTYVLYELSYQLDFVPDGWGVNYISDKTEKEGEMNDDM